MTVEKMTRKDFINEVMAVSHSGTLPDGSPLDEMCGNWLADLIFRYDDYQTSKEAE